MCSWCEQTIGGMCWSCEGRENRAARRRAAERERENEVDQ